MFIQIRYKFLKMSQKVDPKKKARAICMCTFSVTQDNKLKHDSNRLFLGSTNLQKKYMFSNKSIYF